MAEARQQKQAALDTEIARWQEDTIMFSHLLAAKYGRKSEYYLHLMYSHGSKLHTKRKPNAFNAWLHHFAQENEGTAASLVELEQDNIDDYHRLSPSEKAELDVNNVVAKMEELVVGLKCRVGVEGFFCIVCNTSDFNMTPRWFFSAPQLDNYLQGTIRKGWNAQNISSLAEVFTVAGCKFMTFIRTSKVQADWIKGNICDKINAKLMEITRNKKAVMHKLEDKEAKKAPPHKQQRRGLKSVATVPDDADGDATNAPSASQGMPSTVTATTVTTTATATTAPTNMPALATTTVPGTE
ncbi:hypothetical protein B0H21DRAFT_823611 [Amylocystis lapponica]|nr:hypothetical protein B0H21DRAFT_823611 [Amylocystis lapponica]